MMRAKQNTKSFFLTGLFFASVFFGQVWLVVLLGLALIVCTSGIPLIVGALFFDLLYSAGFSLYGFDFVFTGIAIVLVILTTLIKKRLR